jgi:hypothetical protein
MPDGVRTLVVGGTRSQNDTTPVPSVEVFSSDSRSIVSITPLSVLQRFANFILYPLGEWLRQQDCCMFCLGRFSCGTVVST